jgi:hypothetical protein
MHIVLFVLGAVTVMAGFSAIAYGIPVNEFSFGNTLIIAGTTSVVGGLILIGLAATVRQLMRLAERTDVHEVAAALAPQSGSFKAHPHAGVQPTALSPQPSKPDQGGIVPFQPEPKHASAPATDPDPLVWLRPKTATPTFGEQTLLDEMEASLSPHPGQDSPPPTASSPRTVSASPPLKVYEQYVEPKAAAASAAEPAPPFRPEIPARSAPPVEHPQSGGSFDTVWPEIRPARNAETIPRTRKPDLTAPAAVSAPAARENGKAKETPREAQSQTPAPDEQRQVAILKSGMIDGMAYTLYADGSIEAVLATGTIRFASIDALRLHLEKNA